MGMHHRGSSNHAEHFFPIAEKQLAPALTGVHTVLCVLYHTEYPTCESPYNSWIFRSPQSVASRSCKLVRGLSQAPVLQVLPPPRRAQGGTADTEEPTKWLSRHALLLPAPRTASQPAPLTPPQRRPRVHPAPPRWCRAGRRAQASPPPASLNEGEELLAGGAHAHPPPPREGGGPE
eukprot:scaffold278436_cov35-Tisochrysis_lutea.AAC.2